MKIFFGQIYTAPGVSFEWSIAFQAYLSETVTALVFPSEAFAAKYGPDWSLGFRISAKKGIESNEIRGSSVFKRDKDVEFTIFLPFDRVPAGEAFAEPALEFLLDGVMDVLQRLGIDAARLQQKRAEIIAHVCAAPEMSELRK